MRTARRNWTTGRVDACRAEPHPSPSPARRGDGEELRGEERSDPVRDDQRSGVGRYKGLSRPPGNIGAAGEVQSPGPIDGARDANARRRGDAHARLLLGAFWRFGNPQV